VPNFTLCPCYAAVLLAVADWRTKKRMASDPATRVATWKTLRRLAIADEAKRLGWDSVRGRGGRSELLARAVTVAAFQAVPTGSARNQSPEQCRIDEWDSRGAIDAEIETCAQWLDHLRSLPQMHGQTRGTHIDWMLQHHLGGLRHLTCSDPERAHVLSRLALAMGEKTIADALDQPDRLYRRARTRWARGVLARLAGLKDGDAVKRKRRRERTVRVVRIDLTALPDETAEGDRAHVERTARGRSVPVGRPRAK
jgi:hypothetical protein